jgi:hypothetical protein
MPCCTGKRYTPVGGFGYLLYAMGKPIGGTCRGSGTEAVVYYTIRSLPKRKTKGLLQYNYDQQAEDISHVLHRGHRWITNFDGNNLPDGMTILWFRKI